MTTVIAILVVAVVVLFYLACYLAVSNAQWRKMSSSMSDKIRQLIEDSAKEEKW